MVELTSEYLTSGANMWMIAAAILFVGILLAVVILGLTQVMRHNIQVQEKAAEAYKDSRGALRIIYVNQVRLFNAMEETAHSLLETAHFQERIAQTIDYIYQDREIDDEEEDDTNDGDGGIEKDPDPSNGGGGETLQLTDSEIVDNFLEEVNSRHGDQNMQ